jgi:nitrate/nitrite transporter NarK
VFPEIDASQYAFLGPLVGALHEVDDRLALADRMGRSACHASGSSSSMSLGRRSGSSPHFLGETQLFAGFFAMFLLLFASSGVGNASTFQMIPAIMRKDMDRLIRAGRRRGAPASGREGVRSDHRLHLGDRRLRRLLHSQELRLVDRAHRWRGDWRSTASSPST